MKKGNGHRSEPTFIANNDSIDDELSLRIDRKKVRVGSDVTGRVGFGRGSRNVVVEFEGTEYTVVALPGRSNSGYEGMVMQNLKDNTTQKRIFLRQTRLLSPKQSTGFRFGLPDNLPGTIRRTLDGTDDLLPSQCQIKYTVTATIFRKDGDNGNDNNDNNETVSKEIFVLPKKEVDVPIDSSIGVSIGSPVEAMYQSVFVGGKMQGAMDAIFACNYPSNNSLEQDEALLTQDKCIFLKALKNELHLCIGQTLLLEVNDCFHLLSRQTNAIWMLKITEELIWEAKGRKTSTKEIWNLHINHHAIPALIPSYDHNHESLIQVQHTLVVYMMMKDNPNEHLASTGPIQVKILSSQVGWDA